MPASKPLSKERNTAAARFLRVSFNHYRKYAKLYKDQESGKTLFELHKNQAGKGIPKFLGNKGKEPPLIDILEGRIPHYHFSPDRIKQRILAEGLIEEKCNRCGFNERRVLDYRAPLLLHFKNKNKEDYRLDNLELLCYNCYYLYIGNVFNDKQIEAIEDFHDL